MSDLLVKITSRRGGCHERAEHIGNPIKRLGLRTSKEAGWHIVVTDSDGENYVLAYTPFARKKDAEMAKRALEKAGLSSIDAMLEAGPDKVIVTMYEGLAW